MILKELFTKKVITAAPGASIASVAWQMKEHNVGCVVIVEDQRPVGIITDRDIALTLGAEGVAPGAQVATVMSRQVRTIEEDSNAYAAAVCMRSREVRRLPIVDADGRLVGMVTHDDLTRQLGWELFNLGEGIKPEMAVR